MRIQTTQQTVFKTEPIESSSLGPSELIHVPPGQRFAVLHVYESLHGHSLLELASPLTCADGKTHLQSCYAFNEHFEQVLTHSTDPKIDRKTFFNLVRQSLFSGGLTQNQVDGMNSILNYWEAKPSEYNDRRWLAYMLATVFHETARTMQPIREYGEGVGHSYGISDPTTGQRYYGRGFVQLTWLSNYEKFGQILHLDLVNHPDLALQLKPATEIMFFGMIHGSFTSKKLADYFNSQTCDWVNARRIINGLDRAQEVASYGRLFHAAIHLVS